MEDLLQSVLEPLLRRASQLQTLEQALLQGQTAMVESSLERMQQAQDLQQSICRQLTESSTLLDSAIRNFQAAAEPGGGVQAELDRMGPGIIGRLDRAVLAHHRLQVRVRELSGIQQALLRRSERTIRAMQNLVASQHPRYGKVSTGVAGAYAAMQGRSR